MPTTVDVAPPANLWAPQDVDRFNKLPIWMTLQEKQQIPLWTRWAGIGGGIKWEPNKADILQGIIAENSPITRQTFTPRNLVGQEPNTDVASHYERTNTGRPKRHHFESPLFHWQPSFRDFRKNQVTFAVNDLTRQRQIALDLFIRTQAYNYAPNVYVNRKANPIDNTWGSGEATDTTQPKSLSAVATKINDIGFDNIGYLDYKSIVAVRGHARHTIGIEPMDGWKGKPADNETAKGKFLMLGEPSIYENMQFDSHMLNNRPLAMNLVQSDFSGVIAENILFRQEKYSLRYKINYADGTVTTPAPEIEKLLPSTGYGSDKRYETVPNPDYVNAEIGVAFFIGYEPWDDITVGPPPKDFASGQISMSAFGQLNWNGEMRVIKPTIVNYPGGVIASNDYGGFIKVICDCVLGYLPKTPRFVLPIIYRRSKNPSLIIS